MENDVLLPPMKHNIVYMDLDYYALKSYNAMQASLAVNAIDSEREGPVGRRRSVLCSAVAHFDPGLPFPLKCTSRGLCETALTFTFVRVRKSKHYRRP